nr:NTP transferase domain-containing protein [Micromonospora sp. DSM 115978]
LRAGLAALAELAPAVSVDAVVVTLVDQPLVRPEAVSRLVQALGAAPDKAAAVATYGGRQGHPVALRREVWDEVAALAVGDVGARAWLNARPERVRGVGCDELGHPADIDTPADLARLRSWATGPQI